jgi:hypothetical protein
LKTQFELEVKNQSDKGAEKPVVIIFTDAVVDPSAMMIKSFGTSVTLSTMFTCFVGFILAKSTEMYYIN